MKLELDQTSHEPGGTVRGRAEWTGGGGEIRLGWFTRGKGTMDYERVASVSFEQGRREFALQLPVGPWSFSGRLVSVVWAVELKCAEGVMREEFVMAPGGLEVTHGQASEGQPISGGADRIAGV